MKASATLALLSLGGIASAHGALLAYEPFDYNLGSDVTTPLNGGLGFAGAWTAGQQGGKITVYDETAATVTNNTAGGELTWDGAVDNVPTGPPGGSRFIGNDGAVDRITANRVLSQSAGALAGADAVLWASIVWHQQGSNFGRHVGFTLGTDGLSNRSQNVDKTGSFGAGIGDAIGVGGAINTGLVTPVIFDNGAVAVRTTTGATSVSYSQDNLVVLKFEFADGATADTVFAYTFTESDSLSEATFNTNAISASAVIDQDTLDMVSFSQSRGQEAIDEIRLGDTFEDVITGEIAPRQPLEMTEFLYDVGTDQITLTWKSNPGEFYGLYWSEGLTGFEPGVDPAVPAHATGNRTTHGPFANPSPGADSLFMRVGPPDLEDPVLNRLWGNNSTVSLEFSEAMHPAAATDPANFSVVKDGGGPVTVSSAVLSPNGESIVLTTAAALENGSSYTVTMNNLTDLSHRLLGNPTAASFDTWDDDPDGIKVFVLAGQSNMEGHGKPELGNDDNGDGSEDPGAIGSLRYMVVNDTASYGHLLADPGNPSTSPWATRNDVKAWFNFGDLSASSRQLEKGNLTTGFGKGSWIGPEYGFGWALGDHYDDPVLLIKTAWGGKDLHVNFRPPSAAAARGGVVGPYYNLMLDDLRGVLSNLETEFPAAQHPEFAAKSYRYQIAGFAWHQGWNDRINGTFSADYEVNLVDLINDLRAEFGRPGLPVSIGTTGMAPGASYSTVELAQLAVADPAQHPEFDGTVFTVDARPFWRDGSISPSNFGYHWNHNGESHYLLGKAMGDGMVDLLTP